MLGYSRRIKFHPTLLSVFSQSVEKETGVRQMETKIYLLSPVTDKADVENVAFLRPSCRGAGDTPFPESEQTVSP